MKAITPHLWFDQNAEEAAAFYLSIFKNSRLGARTHYSEVGHEVHGMSAGTVMTVAFELNGQPFLALNGGPHFKFNEAVSFMVPCATQEEIDYYWEHLSDGGDPSAQQCGWLKDKFGVSWQIVPEAMERWMGDANPESTDRVTAAFLKMKKLDIATLEQAYRG